MESCFTEDILTANGVSSCTNEILGLLTWTTSLPKLVLPPLLLIILASKLWSILQSSKDPSCKLPLPPGSMGWPLVGETLTLMAQGSEFFRERTKSYGRIYKTHILGSPTIRVTGSENVRKILQGEGELVTSHWPPSTRLILGESALAHSSGHTHSWRRQMIMNAFSTDALKGYLPKIQDIVQYHIKKWCEKDQIHGYPEARNLTFTVAARLLLGFDIKERQKHQMLILFEDMLATLFSMPLPLPGIGLYRGLKARRAIMREIQSCIKERQAEALEGQVQREDALALILGAVDEQGNQKLTAKEVQDSSLEMLFAGHLPTSSAACSCLMMVGNNPQVYDKLAVELHDAGLLLDVHQSPEITYEMLLSLPYLDAVVREVLRLAPPVGAGYRKALKTFEVDGCQIPKGWSVVYSIRETQHTSEMFTNADKFDPDRWLTNRHTLAKETGTNKNGAESAEFEYLPFGWGNRSCVGARFVDVFLKIFLVELVRSCKWKLVDKVPQMLYMPVPHPKDNLPLQFKESPPDLRRRAFTLSW